MFVNVTSRIGWISQVTLIRFRLWHFINLFTYLLTYFSDSVTVASCARKLSNIDDCGLLRRRHRQRDASHSVTVPSRCMAAARASNTLPASVRAASSLTLFRRDLKTALFTASWLSRLTVDRDCLLFNSCTVPLLQRHFDLFIIHCVQKKTPTYVFDYNFGVSWSIFILFVPVEREMNTLQLIYLHSWWRHNCVTLNRWTTQKFTS